MPSFLAVVFSLGLLAPLAHVQADSVVFSQFIGNTVATGPTGTGLAAVSFSACTHYLHALPALSGLQRPYSVQNEQMFVDGACQFCTGLAQTRIDSCCAESTSSACFASFAGGAGAAQSGPASVAATPTGGSGAIPNLPSPAGPTATRSAAGRNTVEVCLHQASVPTAELPRTSVCSLARSSQPWSASRGGHFKECSHTWD